MQEVRVQENEEIYYKELKRKLESVGISIEYIKDFVEKVTKLKLCSHLEALRSEISRLHLADRMDGTGLETISRERVLKIITTHINRLGE